MASAAERRAGESVGFGGPLPTEARRGLRLVSFKSLPKGSLLGFCTLEIRAIGLTVSDFLVQRGRDGKLWVALPAKPVLGQNGRQVETGGGKQYASILKWRDRDLSDRFSACVVDLILDQYPGALE